jgi:hypothetical protein
MNFLFYMCSSINKVYTFYWNFLFKYIFDYKYTAIMWFDVGDYVLGIDEGFDVGGYGVVSNGCVSGKGIGWQEGIG